SPALRDRDRLRGDVRRSGDRRHARARADLSRRVRLALCGRLREGVVDTRVALHGRADVLLGVRVGQVVGREQVERRLVAGVRVVRRDRALDGLVVERGAAAAGERRRRDRQRERKREEERWEKTSGRGHGLPWYPRRGTLKPSSIPMEDSLAR